MIYAIFATTILTIIIGLIAVKARITSVRRHQLRAGYFKLMKGEDAPDIVIKTTRCFNNMFEIPVLFYVVSILYIVLGVESVLALILAWLFVALRAIHACIHIGYNHVLHRLYAFSLSVLCVILLWMNLIIHTL